MHDVLNEERVVRKPRKPGYQLIFLQTVLKPRVAGFSAKHNIHWLLTLCIAQYNTGYSVDIALPRIPKRRTRKQSLNQSAVPTSG